MRANDLVWGPFVAHYLLGEETPASDLLYWFNDGARMPEGLLNTYLREVVRENGLAQPGQVKIDGKAIDLSKVKTPVRFVSMKDDHVSGWQATYKGMSLFGGEVEFVLGGSGHNAGVINPPAANKHGFWTNEAASADRRRMARRRRAPRGLLVDLLAGQARRGPGAGPRSRSRRRQAEGDRSRARLLRQSPALTDGDMHFSVCPQPRG